MLTMIANSKSNNQMKNPPLPYRLVKSQAMLMMKTKLHFNQK